MVRLPDSSFIAYENLRLNNGGFLLWDLEQKARALKKNTCFLFVYKISGTFSCRFGNESAPGAGCRKAESGAEGGNDHPEGDVGSPAEVVGQECQCVGGDCRADVNEAVDQTADGGYFFIAVEIMRDVTGQHEG